MKSLESIRKLFLIIGYLSGGGIFRYQFCHKIVSLFILLLLLAYEFTSLIYVVRHLQIGDIGNSLYAGLQMASISPAIGSFLSLMYHKEKIRELFHNLQDLFDRFVGESSSAVFFTRAERATEKLLRYAFAGLNGSYVIGSLALAVSGAIFYLIRDGHIEPRKLFLPPKISTPINDNSLVGWACLFCIDQAWLFAYGLVHISAAVFFVAIGLYFRACAQHFQSIFTDLCGTVDRNATIEKRRKIKRSIIEAVNFHSHVKSIFDLVHDSMSGVIFFQLTMGVISMSLNNFNVEMTLKKLDLNACMVILAVQATTCTVLLYCFVGKSTTDQFFSFSDIAYEFSWYDLPVDLQKYFPLMIADAQRPKIFTGFNIINLDLGTFTKLMRTVFTYYLMFKRLAK